MKRDQLENVSAVEQLATSVAADLHADWRKGHIAAKGNVPRWKTTTDAAWHQAHAGAPYQRTAGDTMEVDINIPFSDLPVDWQEESVAAANFAARVVANSLLVYGKIDPEALASQVHDAWLTRQRLQPATSGTVPYYVEAGLDRPYADLPREEQLKDLRHIELVMARIE